jgi:hypothetical protein
MGIVWLTSIFFGILFDSWLGRFLVFERFKFFEVIKVVSVREIKRCRFEDFRFYPESNLLLGLLGLGL